MLEGVLNVYKERGYTSHDVVARLRSILRMKRIGHTGTLDPDAEGVLPVCLGQATKLCDMLTDEGKAYQAVMLLGVETDTQDTSGQVLQEKPVQVTEDSAREAIGSFVGGYDQIPPMYSALKVNGKKLYELARQGKTVERVARPIMIHQIDIDSVDLPRVTMTVHCSKGTYIRTLCHDIGQKLGCGGCMEHLLRVKVGRFTVENSLKLDEIERLRDNGEVAEYVVPVERMFEQYPKAQAKPEADKMAHNGNPLRLDQVKVCRESNLDEAGEKKPNLSEVPDTRPEKYRMYDSRGRFLGIYEYQPEKERLKPLKMFLPEEDL